MQKFSEIRVRHRKIEDRVEHLVDLYVSNGEKAWCVESAPMTSANTANHFALAMHKAFPGFRLSLYPEEISKEELLAHVHSSSDLIETAVIAP